MGDLDLNRPIGDSFEYANVNSVVLGRSSSRSTVESGGALSGLGTVASVRGAKGQGLRVIS